MATRLPVNALPNVANRSAVLTGPTHFVIKSEGKIA